MLLRQQEASVRNGRALDVLARQTAQLLQALDCDRCARLVADLGDRGATEALACQLSDGCAGKVHHARSVAAPARCAAFVEGQET